MMVYCEYQEHKAPASDHLDALRLTEIELYGGPRDGESMLYSGLVYRIPGHTDGAYCFDGQVYKWLASGCEQNVNNS
jgi:hypothetical protein